MIVSRIINPTSKLGTVRGIRAETASSSLGELLGLSHGDRNEYYEALDWLLSKQIDIENALATILFEEEEIEKLSSSDLEELLRYQPSAIAKQKAGNKRNQENLPVHSFSTLLNDLATITQNKIQINLQGERVTFDKITQPTALQQKALDLLGVSLICTQ